MERPLLKGANGKFQHSAAKSYYVFRSGVYPDYDQTLDHNTLYHVRVGTCLTVDCDLGDAAFAPERSIRTAADPN